ncbi:hypothetical protein [uncultured Marixanthomonas sp.]|uniref:hypothetical protein n=1 Tax=uncultured Marixanthomonas sp. TaxID=757245 RepID=UPI0030DB3D58|tara:strand:+ start:92059 stop:92487 length:429 start_codon:yes stop_codon:yes gene_type:complete
MKSFLTLLISFSILSCSTEPTSCYRIGKINIAKENGSGLTESVYLEITDKKTIEKLSGTVLFADVLKPKYDTILFLEGKDTIDSNTSSRIKKSSDGIYLVYRTGRFLFDDIRDSTQIADIIKNEKIKIRLADNSIIKLNYCE